MMGDVGHGFPVLCLSPAELFESELHPGKGARILVDEAGEFVYIPSVKLNETASKNALENQLEVHRRLGEKWKKGQTGPKINGDQAAAGIRIAFETFEGVGLALASPPFILAGQLLGSHVVHQRDKPGHKSLLAEIFRGPSL